MAKMENRERLLRKMAAIPEEIRKAMKDAIAAGADEIVGMQRRLAPVKTGALRASIVATFGGSGPAHASVGGGGGGDSDLSVRITAGNSGVRYAHLVEFGTAPHVVGGIYKGALHPGSVAKPFFYPGYRALKRRVKSRITRATKKAIRKAAAG